MMLEMLRNAVFSLVNMEMEVFVKIPVIGAVAYNFMKYSNQTF